MLILLKLHSSFSFLKVQISSLSFFFFKLKVSYFNKLVQCVFLKKLDKHLTLLVQND